MSMLLFRLLVLFSPLYYSLLKQISISASLYEPLPTCTYTVSCYDLTICKIFWLWALCRNSQSSLMSVFIYLFILIYLFSGFSFVSSYSLKPDSWSIWAYSGRNVCFLIWWVALRLAAKIYSRTWFHSHKMWYALHWLFSQGLCVIFVWLLFSISVSPCLPSKLICRKWNN